MILFWKRNQPYGEFSQWYPSPFIENNVMYKNAEQYMMAEKARLFNDYDTLALIMDCHDPAQIKALGRRVKPFVPSVWNTHRYNIVLQGTRLKFTQNADLKTLLKSTTGIIAEASPMDKIWGIGLGPNNANAQNPANWRGANLLGRALMECRSEL